MKTKKVTVKENDIAYITCPSCQKTKKIPVTHFKETGKRQLKVRCCCENVFDISLECRKYYRKQTKLLGKSVNLSNHRETQDIIIKNISSGGVGFCPFKKHKTRKNDRLQVSFILSDAHQTQIEADVTVQSTTHEYVGCEFNSTEKFTTPLGFFLTS